jgi:hypothetical protein
MLRIYCEYCELQNRTVQFNIAQTVAQLQAEAVSIHKIDLRLKGGKIRKLGISPAREAIPNVTCRLRTSQCRKGFSLAELLIVVPIILDHRCHRHSELVPYENLGG